MTALALVLTVLASLTAIVWASRHRMIIRQRHGFVLTEDYGAADGARPRISVMVAAKDEQDNIAACVRTMLDQDYPNFEMIVVNDRSTDATAEIVERMARQDDRLRLIHISDLPAGWCGKTNAMQHGIAAADGEWICMIDADCWQQSTRTLRVAMRYAIDTGADLLSVLPNLEVRTFWENVVQPVCGGVMMIWFHPDKVNDPDRPHAYANGAFMLMRRGAYQRVGTHEAVKNRVNEDMHLAALTKAAGLSLRVVTNEGLYQVRMYTSLRQIVRGWSRIFYGTFGTARRMGISLAVLVTMGMVPYAAAIFGAWAAAAGAAPTGLLAACGIVGAAAVAMQLSVVYRFYPLAGAKASMAWTYLLGCLIGSLALILALGKLRPGARLTWRNTTYTHGPAAS